MKIEPGFYIKKVIEPNAEILKEMSLINQIGSVLTKYYLILGIYDKQMDVLLFEGTPPLGSDVVNYNDVADSYTIEEIPLKEIKLTPIYRYCKINSLVGAYQVALRHEWHGKEFTRLLKQTYWDGYQWRNNEDFWNSMEDAENVE